jgi:hypothetical protein
MQKRKRALWISRILPFVLVWSISLAAIGFMARAFTSLVLAPLLPTDQTLLISRLLGTILPALVQVQLVERLLKRSMRSWMPYTLPGVVLTLILMSTVQLLLPAPQSRFDLTILLSVFAFIVPIPLIQALWLQKRVRRAWLWPTAAVFAALAFAAFPSDGSNSHVLWLILTLIYGLMQGTVMHTLWANPIESEKAKVDFDIDDQSHLEHDRIERLQTAEYLPTLSTSYADEQTIARKTQ